MATDYRIGGYKLRMLAPVRVRPAWWDVLRHLHLAPAKTVQLVRAGSFLVDGSTRTLYLRPEDYWRIVGPKPTAVVTTGPRPSVWFKPEAARRPLVPETADEACHRLRLAPPARV